MKDNEHEKDNDKELLSLTNDYVFRKIFGETDVNALGDFLTSILDMPEDEFAELSVEDPHLYREYEGGKGAELDIRAKSKNGEIINIEIQVLSEFSDKTCYPINYVIRLKSENAELIAA